MNKKKRKRNSIYESRNNDACEAGDSQEHASFQMIIATRKSNERFSSDGLSGNYI